VTAASPWRLFSVLLAGAVLLAACGGGGDAATGEADSTDVAGNGGTDSSGAAQSGEQELTIGMGALLSNYDPVSTQGINDYINLRLVYDTLVSVDSGTPEPWAAESWEALDATHWRFKIREGIEFSNGEPFDAEAVRYTFQRALDDPENPWRVRIENLQSMEVVDDHTIDFILDAPVGNWPTRLAVVWIVPPEHSEQNDLATEPVGSGPFTVESFSPGESVVLKGRDDYWNGTPKLETVTFRAIPEDSTRVSALLAGDIDVAHRILPEFVDQVESAGHEVQSVPSGLTANVFFQASRSESPVADQRVRQALDFALDKEAISEGVTAGLGGTTQGQAVSENSVGFNPTVEPRPYDPERARELLAEAGYPDGFEINFDYSVGRYFRDKELVESVVGYWREIGVNVQQNPMEGGAWLDRIYTGEWGPVSYWSFQDAPFYDISVTMEIFKSDGLRRITNDPELDAYLDDADELVDPDERQEHLAEFSAYLADQAYIIPFHQDPGLYAVSSRVRDISFLPSTYINLVDAFVAE
jgi:peptide/nickel transport system substrate-binding protein